MLSKLYSILVCSYCLLILCSAPTVRAETFRNPYRIPTPTDPSSIAAGDLNGDGIADFVWLDLYNSPGTVKVFLSQPGGGYLPGPDVLSGSSTIHPDICVMTDVNNDAHLDLVCTGGFTTQAYIWVFLGHGDGTFDSPVTTPITAQGVGSYVVPAVAAVGDLNGDGLKDILYADEANDIFLVMLSDGNGGFQNPKPLGFSFINGGLPVAADVNGDGIPDLLGPVGPQVALGKGDGTFSLPTNYEQPFDYLATCVYHDMDGDGHLDAVCGYAETTSDGDITGGTDLIILHGNADGSFNPTPIAHQVYGDHANEYDGFGTFQTPLAVADLNGDGIPDILAAAGDGQTVLMGGPGLSFGTPRHYAQAVVGYDVSFLATYQSQILDVNGDGIPDVVSAGPNGIYISYGHAEGTFGSAPAYEATEVIGYATIADFNGDGIPDIVATGDANIKLSLGNGDGTFAEPVAAPNGDGAVNFGTPLSATGAHIAHGDFNGDGKLDLLAIGSSSIYVYNTYMLLGNGDGTFQSPVQVPDSSTLFPMSSQLTDAAIYDVNRDGRSDVLSISGTFTTGPALISVALSNGDGSFQSVTTAIPSDLQNGSFYYPNTLPALGDFFGHGQFDAAYGSLSHVYVLKGHGDGTFDQTGTTIAIPAIGGSPSLGALSVASGDFDGDGKLDFVVLVQYGIGQFPFPSPLATAAWVFFGNGDGTFAAPVLAGEFDRNYAKVAVADLNRDGLSDMVLSTSGSLAGGYAVGVVNAEPGRTFAGETNYTAGTGLSSLAISDLNGDGFLDLLFANGDFNLRASSVTVLLNMGNVPTVTGTLAASPEPSNVGQSFQLTATLASPLPGAPLAGGVTFSINGNSLGTAALVNNAATIAGPNTLAVGVYQITANWPGDGTYSAVNLTSSHVVSAPAAASSLSLTSNANPTPALTPVTFTVHLTVNGQAAPAGTPIGLLVGTNTSVELTTDATGSATYTIGTLVAGSYLVTANFAGVSGLLPSSASLIETVTASNIIATATSLSASPNPANQGQAVTLSASVTAGASAVSSGTVSFYDGSVLLGTGTLRSSGQATLVTSSLAAGTHPLTAVFPATGLLATSTSAVVQEVILPATSTSTFTLALSPSTRTIVSGQQGSVAILLTSLGAFAGPLSLSYGALPNAVSASIQPTTVTLSAGGTASSKLLLNTYALVSNASPPAQNSRKWPALAAVFLLPALTAIGRRRNWRRLLGVLLAVATLQIFTGCANTWHEGNLATPGTYQLSITATDVNNNSQTATLTIVITP
jgi:Bacterial Ig-like domain (group 3)/FG-GAP-like repeat